jgi:glycosyltransferase involved in cell wall biosynthesis
MPAVIQARKQQVLLVEVLKGLVDNCINAYAVLAGAVGDETYKQLLDDKIRELGMAERVRQIGFVEEMAHFYAGCDVTASFSISETFGMSAAESLACGVPLVYFDLPVLQEVVGDGGLAVSINDIDGAIAACTQLSSESPMYQKLAQAGRQKVEQKYSPSESAGALVGFYENVLQRKEVRR